MASAEAWRRACCALATLGLTLAVAPDARAIEAFDGRIQAHGFFEAQVRALDSDFAEEIDLSQWYNVFNLELEADILPDGWGPFDLLQAYVRVEARYDAIYNQGMWLFPSVNTWGDGSRRLPLRLRDAIDQDYAGVIESNAQAVPPGIPKRVPDAGDLPAGRAQGPDEKSYGERDPVGFSVEVIESLPLLNYRPDDNGDPTPDAKNPVDPNDLDMFYVSERTGAEFVNPPPSRIVFDEDPLTLDRVEADCSQVACRALPANGFDPDSPPRQGGIAPAGDQAAPRDGEYHELIDTGTMIVEDPLTGERATVAELYGDIQLVENADGELEPVDGGRAVNGFGSRIQGAVVTDSERSPILAPFGTARLIGFNTTCPTNRKDTRNAFARVDPNDASSDFLYGPEVRQSILQSGEEGSCLDNRPAETVIQRRLGFPGFDTLFEGEGADAELGRNPDFSNPDLVDRTTPVSDLAATVDQKLQDPAARDTIDGQMAMAFPGLNPMGTGGLNGTDDDDLDAYFVEQELINDFAPFFRGIAQPRDDPAFYVFDGSPDRDESIVDWRFTFTDIKGPQGGVGQTRILGPWLPKNFFEPAATWADRANPFRGRETPTLTARNEFVTNKPFEQTPRRVGERYQLLDVAATEQALVDAGVGGIPEDDPAFDYVPDEVGTKLSTDPADTPGGKVLDPNTGNLVALDLENAKFQPEDIDSRLERVDQLVTLLGDAGIRLRRNINRPSQLQVGQYPNDILRLPELRNSINILGAARITPLLQRDGTSLGGDFSGIIPCLDTQRNVTRTDSPAPAQLEAQLAGSEFGRGCIPFTNVNATGGRGELPMRPGPDLSNLLAGSAEAGAQGLYIPSAGFREVLGEVDLDNERYNINENERAWNRGASQQQTYEVKEAYADMEFLDSRLWIRAGLQNIVWGKTELFRTTDQFNPQDLALASLPSLEESRIALVSARAVYSLYDVGPLQDVRLEFAANIDRFEPADLGLCGEPYTIDVVCGITTGIAFHGLTGIGIAGEDRPPNAWNDIDGVEFGGRIEFRWDRFSFAIVDFYGYNDLPFADQIFSYSRNIDASTGRPLQAFATGSCENAAGFADRNPAEFGPDQEVTGAGQREPGVFFPGFGVVPVATSFRAFSGGNRRLAGEVDFDARRPLLQATGDRSALPTGIAPEFGVDTENPRDDYYRHPLAYTIQGIGIDPSCLKPGGAPGGPNENRFDPDLAPEEPLQLVFDDAGNLECVDVDADGICTFVNEGGVDRPRYASRNFSFDPDNDLQATFNHTTFGQWEAEGQSIDYALGFHPGNQQLFAFTCLATVSISASLDPGACAWTIFGTSRNISSVIDVPLSELVSMFTAGERGDPIKNLSDAILSNTKGQEAEFGNIVPLVALSRDARDGLTTAASPSVTGLDPLNPADLEDRLTIGNTMTAEQMALLGCGPFFGTRCDTGRQYNTDVFLLNAIADGDGAEFRPPPARPFRGIEYAFSPDPSLRTNRIDTAFEYGANSGGGIDPLNMEGSAVVQAFPGLEGTAEVRGTTRVLRRVTEQEVIDNGLDASQAGELSRLGDGTIDLRPFVRECTMPGQSDCVPLSTDFKKFAIPNDPLDSSIDPQQRTYLQLLDARDALTVTVAALDDELDRLRDNPDDCDEAAPVLDPNNCGLNQYLNREFVQGGLSPADSAGKTMVETDIDVAETAQDFALNGDDLAVDGLNDILLILDDATEQKLLEFSQAELDDPDSGLYEPFGRTRQETVDGTEVEDGGIPLEVPLAGAVVDGLEDFGAVTDHVTWSNAPQPGTLGNAGLAAIQRDANGNFVSGAVQRAPNPFFGGEYCTRYEPGSPFANEAGIVRLPGCRSALSVTVNIEAPAFDPESFFFDQNANAAVPYSGTIEVVFEDFYDPRVDGCVFGPTVRSQDGRIYKVQAVNGDGTLDGLTQDVLDATCFNQGTVDSNGNPLPRLVGVQSQAINGRQFIRLPTSPGGLDGDLDEEGNPIVEINNDGTTSFRASTSRRARDPLDNYSVRPGIPQAFTETLYHPWAGCEGAAPIPGSPLTSIPLSDFQGRAIGRGWAVDRAAPAIDLQDQRDNTGGGGNRINLRSFARDGTNFVIDAGVEVDISEADDIADPDAPVRRSRDANSGRATFVCDVRTRDFDNDFLEGALTQDLNGDGYVSAGAQVFRSEMAAWSWNFLMFLTITSCNATSGGDDLEDADCFRPSTPWALNRCSFSQPQFCRNVKGILGVAGVQRNDARAGGNGTFGRRDFIWHSGGELVLRYKKRNVFGVSADFAEDVTKTNWGVEFTWIGPRPFLDNDSFRNSSKSHTFNLTVSVDRPTFINFLNANRTFFMNTQWFFQYLPSWDDNFISDGPFNALFTFAVFTGYYQDRLLPQVVTVYDFRSQSGGFLPQVSYRFTEAFSITIGVSFFIGRAQRIRMPVNGFAPTANRAGPQAYTDGVERLLSLIRNRDEAFMRIRWTF
ncbi:MAG: hypothetical protein QNK04_09985 [Myxococcota bacterium]|nr:hypothetical protein [Myxococcota bacterium]